MKKLCYLAALVMTCGFVFFASPLYAATWHVPGDFATIQDAIDSSSVSDGDKIMVGAGSRAGAIVTKMVEIKGESGAVIDSGPLPWPGVRSFMAGFLFSGNGVGSGATISHLRFETVEFPVFSRGADDVTVEHCQLNDPIQGVTNWMGSGWSISHNVIIDLRTANGGGIGIICADYRAVPQGVNNSIISHNNIMGTLHVHPNDGGGYDGSGIVLYADFRWGSAGAVEIAHNRIVKNKVGFVSDTPDVVDVIAIELTEAQDPDPYTDVIHDNSVGFNDLRGTQLQIALTPSNLDNPVNNISRNLGNNRGQGLHPKLFGPGGN